MTILNYYAAVVLYVNSLGRGFSGFPQSVISIAFTLNSKWLRDTSRGIPRIGMRK